MKRAHILGTLAVILIIAASSCTKKEAAHDPNTLTIWGWDPNYNVLAVNVAAEIYKRENPDVKINMVEVGTNEIQQRLITAFTARRTADLPDIVLIQDRNTEKFLATYPDAFLPVTGKVDISQFAGFARATSYMDGKNYGVHFGSGVTGTFIRRDIVEQAGLNVSDFNDTTWERFMELGMIVKEKTGASMLSTPMETDLIQIMLQSTGALYFDENGNTNIRDNQTLKSVLEILRGGIESGVILMTNDWPSYLRSFNSGTTASVIQGVWIIGSIVPETSQSGKWAVVNTPRFANIDSVNYSSNGGSNWMVLASSKNQDLAMDFLGKTFAGSVELFERILPTSGAVATWLPALASPVYQEPQAFFGGQRIFADFADFSDRVPPIRYGPFNSEAHNAVIRYAMDVLTGSMSVEDALNRAQSEADFVIRQ